MKLRQTFSEPIFGYWDSGARQVFDWSIEGSPATDSKGQYSKIGSFSANHWFHVATGKTVKLTLANARRRLLAAARKHGLVCEFSYVEE